jgi:hypothetical protein
MGKPFAPEIRLLLDFLKHGLLEKSLAPNRAIAYNWPMEAAPAWILPVLFAARGSGFQE